MQAELINLPILSNFQPNFPNWPILTILLHLVKIKNHSSVLKINMNGIKTSVD